MKALLRFCSILFILINGIFQLSVQTTEICPVSPIPNNWVIVDLSPNSCGVQKKFIIKNSQNVTERSLEVYLTSPIPTNWLIVNLLPNTCGSVQKKFVVYNATKVTEQTIEICPTSPIPTGWVKTGLLPNTFRCEKNGTIPI